MAFCGMIYNPVAVRLLCLMEMQGKMKRLL